MVQYELTMEDYERDRKVEEQRVTKMLSNTSTEGTENKGVKLIEEREKSYLYIDYSLLFIYLLF